MESLRQNVKPRVLEHYGQAGLLFPLSHVLHQLSAREPAAGETNHTADSIKGIEFMHHVADVLPSLQTVSPICHTKWHSLSM